MKIKKNICALIVIVILCTVIILIMDYYNWPSHLLGFQMDNFNNTLVASIVTILGSFIAGTLTLYGVIVTIKENRNDKVNETKNLIKPLIKITSAEYDYKWKYIQFDFLFTNESKKRERKDISDTANITLNFKNIGQRELCNFYLCEFKSTYFDEGGNSYKFHPIIYSGDSVNINFFVYEKGSYDKDNCNNMFDTFISPVTFICVFDDCLGNHYKQKFEITLFHNITPKVPLEKSALSISIDRIKICSAPMEIDSAQYKKLIGNAWECGGE